MKTYRFYQPDSYTQSTFDGLLDRSIYFISKSAAVEYLYDFITNHIDDIETYHFCNCMWDWEYYKLELRNLTVKAGRSGVTVTADVYKKEDTFEDVEEKVSVNGKEYSRIETVTKETEFEFFTKGKVSFAIESIEVKVIDED